MNFKSIINDICCDIRIKNGIFRLDNAEHVFILQEYLEKNGYSIEEIVNKTSKLFESGRFPERQAYNKDGILVTFPTKEYRDKAVDKGTHFAENPKKGDTTLFAPGAEGDLSTSDIKTTTDKEEDGAENKSIPLDQELKNKIIGFDDEDERTSREKSQDAVAVQSILTGQSPLVNYSIDEVIKYGFYKKGLIWYDSEGNFVGEQVYNEKLNKIEIISEKKTTDADDLVVLQNKKKEQADECNSIKMEYWINDELNNKESNNSIAKKIADSLRKSGVISSKSQGKNTCDITNPLFKTIKEISKTDLILQYKNNEFKRVSLKNKNASLCQAQNQEINSVITTILKLNNEEERVIKAVSSFILDGLNKSFYVELENDIKQKLQSSLSDIIKAGESTKLTKQQLEQKAQDIKEIILTNKKYVQKGCFNIDITGVLAVLNDIFTDVEKRKMYMREMITGQYRWGTNQVCVADYLMCWDCAGQQVTYPVEQFIEENLYTINFRFRNRGGERGICTRTDQSPTPKVKKLEEELQQIDESLNISLQQIWNLIKNLTGYIKDFFVDIFNFVKNELKEIKILISDFIENLKNIASKGWSDFTDYLGFESSAEGSWIFKTPTSSTLEEESSLVEISPTNKTIKFEDYDHLDEVFFDESFIKENNLFELTTEKDIPQNEKEKQIDDKTSNVKKRTKNDNIELDVLRKLGLSRLKDEEIINNLNQDYRLITLSQGSNNKYGLTSPVNYKGLESILQKEKKLVITYAGNVKKIRTKSNIRIAEWDTAKSIKSENFKRAIMVYNFYINNKDKIELIAKEAAGLGHEITQVNHLNEWFDKYTKQPLRLFISDESRHFRDTQVEVNGAAKLPGSGKADLVLTKDKSAQFWISYKHGNYWTEEGSELSPVPFQQYGSIKNLNKSLTSVIEKDKWNNIMIDFLTRVTKNLNEPKIIGSGKKFVITKNGKISSDQKDLVLSEEEKNLILLGASTLNKVFSNPSNENLTKKIYFLPKKFNSWMDLLDGSRESKQISGMSIYGLNFKLDGGEYGPENVHCLIQTNEPIDVKIKLDTENEPIGIEMSTDKRGHILFNPNLPAPENAEDPILQYRPVINGRYTESERFVYTLESEIIILLGCRILIMPYGKIPGTSISL